MGDEKTGGFNIGSVTGDLSFQAGGDIVAGNKTVINNIIQQIAKELTTTPYKFLASYEVADRDIFYGRDAIIEELAAQVGRHKVILINGASGAGKSSLVNAGLIPRIANNGYTYVAFREYSDPLAQLQEYFAAARDVSPAQFSPGPVDDSSLLRLIRAFHAFPTVIFLDQFERFFVRVENDTRLTFIAAIKHCLQNSDAKDLCFVLVFRREFLGQLMTEFEEQIPEFLNQAYRINLLPLRKAEAREAILKPLEKTSLKIQYDEDFVDSILLGGLAEQTIGGASIDPPHLQIVCNQLFEAARQRLQSRSSALIDQKLYDELGGAQNILNIYLDKVVEDIAHDPERIAVVHSILKTMIDAGTNTRSFVAMDGFKRAMPDVNETEILKFIEKLLDRRVVEERKPAYSLSHEHMVRKVKEWFDPRELERKRAEETLNRGMMEWKNSGALLNRGQVDRVRKWIPEPTEEAHELLRASEENYLEEERKEANRKKLKTVSVYGAVAFTVVVMILGGYSWFQKNEAETALREAIAGRLVMQSRAILEGQRADTLDMALLLAATGFRLNPNNEAHAELQHALTMTPLLSKVVSFSEPLLAFSNDGRTLITVRQKSDAASLLGGDREAVLHLWDPATGSQRGAPLSGFKFAPSIAFSPDGNTVATGSAEDLLNRNLPFLHLWDVASGQARGAPLQPGPLAQGPKGGVYRAPPHIAFSPDGGLLVSSRIDGSLRLLDVAGGKERSTPMLGHTDQVRSVAFSPDGKTLISGSDDKTLRLWDVASGRAFGAPMPVDTGKVRSVVFSPDGKTIASSSDDGSLRLWNVDSPEGAPKQGDAGKVTTIVFSPDGKTIISGGRDGALRMWDVASGRETGTPLQGHSGAVTKVAFIANQTLVSNGDDKTLRSWDFSAWRTRGTSLQGHVGKVTSVAVSPDSKTIVSGGNDGTLRLWDATTGQPRGNPVPGFVSDLTIAVFSPDGNTLASLNGDGALRVWDVGLRAPSGEPSRDIPRADLDKARRVAFSPDGTLVVSAASDGSLRLFETRTGRPRCEPWKAHGNLSVSDVAFSLDGKTIISAAYGGVRLWNSTTCKQRGPVLPADTGMGVLVSVAVSPDGRTAVAGGTDSLLLWDAVSGALRNEMQASRQLRPTSVAFSPDGKTIVSGGSDGTIRLWDATSGQALGVPLQGPKAAVTGVTFSPDGKIVVSGHNDGTVHVWNAPDAWIDRVCAKLVRNLSQVEWNQHVGNIPYVKQCPELPVPKA